MHLLLTRPDTGPDGDSLAQDLSAAGHRITRAPLLTITHTGTLPSLDGVKALIATSSNGLRAVAPFPAAALRLPLYAVGPATAALGHALGFQNVAEGAGDGRSLSDLIRTSADPSAGALLHLSGDTLAFDLAASLKPHGFEVRRAIVYQADAAAHLPPEVVDALGSGAFDGVVLMSPRTARIYAALIAETGLAAKAVHLAHFCLSEAVAREALRAGPSRVAVARQPNSQEMLALIARAASESA